MEGDGVMVLLKSIEQKDNHTFSVCWSDGVTQHFRLSTLQKHCPCAACVDEATGKRLTKPEKIDAHLKAVSLKSVGRYALKITFTSGCSSGIYEFDYLRKLAVEHV